MLKRDPFQGKLCKGYQRSSRSSRVHKAQAACVQGQSAVGSVTNISRDRMFYLIEPKDNRSCFSESYRLDVFFQNHSYGLSMFGILLGDDGQVAYLISVVVLKILQRFLKVQSDLIRDLVGRHDSSKAIYYLQQ
jgi:hypothetical protein